MVEKAKIPSIEEIVTAMSSKKSMVLNGNALVQHVMNLLDAVDVVAGGFRELEEQKKLHQGQTCALAMTEEVEAVFTALFQAAYNVKAELYSHALAAKEIKESGPSDSSIAPRPTVRDVGHS